MFLALFAVWRAGGNKLLVPDPALLTQGPSDDVLTFLSQDPPEAAAALADNGCLQEGQESPSRDAGTAPTPTASSAMLRSQKSLARLGSDVSELWLVEWAELQLQKQIGEGSFGKVS
jgi:hypothetical protein